MSASTINVSNRVNIVPGRDFLFSEIKNIYVTAKMSLKISVYRISAKIQYRASLFKTPGTDKKKGS